VQIIGINKGIIERRRERERGMRAKSGWPAPGWTMAVGGREEERVQPLDICN